MKSPTDQQPPIRVLHLLPGSDAGGTSRYVFDLSFAMHNRGHSIAVAGQRGTWHWLFETAPFRWLDAPLKKGWLASGRSASVINSYLDAHPVDVLHVHHSTCMGVARKIQKRRPIPILYTMHQSNLRLNWPWSLFRDFGDHTHVASKESRTWLANQAKVPQQLISIVPHGVDPERFPIPSQQARQAARDLLGIKPEHVVAAYVGRMDTPKNEEWMLDLADKSRDRLPNLKVIMVGEGPHEIMLRRRMTEMNLLDRVILLGHRDPMPIYHAADALLLPSQREGFSLVCAEAMSTGIPVLRTRTAGTDALVIENATGKSCEIDHDQFIACAIDFLADPDALQRMGRLAARHVHTHFTYERQLADTVDLYRSLVHLQGGREKPDPENQQPLKTPAI